MVWNPLSKSIWTRWACRQLEMPAGKIFKKHQVLWIVNNYVASNAATESNRVKKIKYEKHKKTWCSVSQLFKCWSNLRQKKLFDLTLKWIPEIKGMFSSQEMQNISKYFFKTRVCVESFLLEFFMFQSLLNMENLFCITIAFKNLSS